MKTRPQKLHNDYSVAISVVLPGNYPRKTANNIEKQMIQMNENQPKN